VYRKIDSDTDYSGSEDDDKDDENLMDDYEEEEEEEEEGRGLFSKVSYTSNTLSWSVTTRIISRHPSLDVLKQKKGNQRQRTRAHSGHLLRSAESFTTSSLPSAVGKEAYPDAEITKNMMKARALEFDGMTPTVVIQALTRDVPEAEPAEVRDALHSMLYSSHHVDRTLVERAVDKVNKHNQAIHQMNATALFPCCQNHGGDTSSRVSVSGGFPVTTAVSPTSTNRNDTLSEVTNATVITMGMLLSPDNRSPVRESAVVSNLVPTTCLGDYTAVPGPDIYGLFEAAYHEFMRELVRAGVDVHVGIANTNAQVLLAALYNVDASDLHDVLEGLKPQPKSWQFVLTTLRAYGGSRLLLIRPKAMSPWPPLLVVSGRVVTKTDSLLLSSLNDFI